MPEKEMELIKILGDFIRQQFPNIDHKDPKACADAYGKLYFGERFIRSGQAEWVNSQYGDVLKTSYVFFEEEPVETARALDPGEPPKDPPMGPAEPMPRPEGVRAV